MVPFIMLYLYFMNKIELQRRTKKFNIDIISFCNSLPETPAGFEIAKQLIRSAGSVGANYRATSRSKSEADFGYKLKIVLEEIDESHYWLEIIKESELSIDKNINRLIQEANELTAIFASENKTFDLRTRAKEK
ncbi:four helix bundle protein [Sediminibacterium goheungense]|uniref:Four helix bundle protein n=2 Tax=Sediminibacterium goheungense TaxID=1086393 RepID=A0A4R6J0M3_9BACT|nr:four helix bundle protein [Sediminibacterium goheungense]